MNICAISSSNTVTVSANGKSYPYFSVPDSVIRRLRIVIRKGGNGFNLLAPYAATKEEINCKRRRELCLKSK